MGSGGNSGNASYFPGRSEATPVDREGNDELGGVLPVLVLQSHSELTPLPS